MKRQRTFVLNGKLQRMRKTGVLLWILCITAANLPSVLLTGALFLLDLWPPPPPRGAESRYLGGNPEGRCNWRSSGQVGSASVCLHNNVLVPSPEHMGPTAPGDKGGFCLNPLIADSEHLYPPIAHAHTSSTCWGPGGTACHTLRQGIMLVTLVEDEQTKSESEINLRKSITTNNHHHYQVSLI